MSGIQVTYSAIKSEGRSNSLTFHVVAIERWAPRYLGVARKKTLCGVTANTVLGPQPVHFANCHKCRRAARSLGISLLPPKPEDQP